jgi:hypothetical protein
VNGFPKIQDDRTAEYAAHLEAEGIRRISFGEFRARVEACGYKLRKDFNYRNTANAPHAWNAAAYTAIGVNGDGFANVSNAKHPGIRALQDFRGEAVYCIHLGRLVEL